MQSPDGFHRQCFINRADMWANLLMPHTKGSDSLISNIECFNYDWIGDECLFSSVGKWGFRALYEDSVAWTYICLESTRAGTLKKDCCKISSNTTENPRRLKQQPPLGKMCQTWELYLQSFNTMRFSWEYEFETAAIYYCKPTRHAAIRYSIPERKAVDIVSK